MHQGIIHKIIGLYIDNDEDKRDVRQEILCQAWKGYAHFKGQSKFSTWLYKVTLNTVLNHQKKKPQAEVQTIDESDQSTEKHELLYSIIKELNEVDKMLITLHLDGYGNIEIAKITGMTSNHINVKLYRIKKVIAERFKIEDAQ